MLYSLVGESFFVVLWSLESWSKQDSIGGWFLLLPLEVRIFCKVQSHPSHWQNCKVKSNTIKTIKQNGWLLPPKTKAYFQSSKSTTKTQIWQPKAIYMFFAKNQPPHIRCVGQHLDHLLIPHPELNAWCSYCKHDGNLPWSCSCTDAHKKTWFSKVSEICLEGAVLL